MKITVPLIRQSQLSRYWHIIINRIKLFVEIEFYGGKNPQSKQWCDFFDAYSLTWKEKFYGLHVAGPPAFTREELLEMLALLNLYFHVTPVLKRRFSWMFKADETHQFAENLKSSIEHALTEHSKNPES
jgi:hypothetical protein